MNGWDTKPAPVKLGAPLSAEDRQAAQVAQPDPEQTTDPLAGWLAAPDVSVPWQESLAYCVVKGDWFYRMQEVGPVDAMEYSVAIPEARGRLGGPTDAQIKACRTRAHEILREERASLGAVKWRPDITFVPASK